ncbi:MAG: F0F1 ATP synthase subunit gamma [Oceanicaulis sp.]|jgi:F-type H+-transporting ATPase subunit gamma|uniref:F0F1 ATP synthase subunit gamma n=1 Tax=unclassified Oceanicaulis TaxID=2632123 RepID=UPI0000669805|nr:MULTISPECIES: F0F1 ATP synthase subunit gamma [unclassified Oceanicaulis]EAP89394.1 ATP synthase subunit C [Oceanicaulis sp. HTCC2633]MBC40265.1 F0F1 ATP synthase subunit gamma [Oceanicaulis sp.]
MASLKELKNRINSVESTKKITKAMQMVAAAKLRKAQEAAEAARPYAERMAAVMANLSSAMEGPDAPRLLVGTGKDDVHLLVVATADRGLCGGFNTNIARLARERVAALVGAGKTVKILTVGKKGYEALKRLHKDKIVDTVELKDVKSIDGSTAAMIGDKIRTLFEAGEFDVCEVVSSEFVSVISQKPRAQTLIPARDAIDETVERPDLKGAIYSYEPDEESILEVLLPRYVDTVILSALLENAAGEMGAKMAAMDSATRNAGELIDKLNLEYNRSRQAKITKELIEIISGAEAV